MSTLRSRGDQGRHCERVHWVSGDLGDPAVPPRLVEETAKAHGRIDALVVKIPA